MIASINAALADGITKIEVSFPPVPNLEEVDFGTAVNQQFSNEIRKELGVSGKAYGSDVRRNLVDFANHFWACRSVECRIPQITAVTIFAAAISPLTSHTHFCLTRLMVRAAGSLGCAGRGSRSRSGIATRRARKTQRPVGQVGGPGWEECQSQWHALAR